MIPLAVISEDETSNAWAKFVARRDALTKRMALSVCSGCDQCGLRCTSGIRATPEEHAAIADYLATLPPARVARVLSENKTVPWPGAEDTGATVTYCRYRDMERENCLVYPARPTVCRLLGHTPWLPCPIEAVPFVPDGTPELWRDYVQFDRRALDE